LLPIKNGGKRHTRCDKSAILDATNQPIYNIEAETTSETTTKTTKDDHGTALFDRLAQEWLTVNPTQLTGHKALVDRYGWDNWLRGFEACSPKTRPNLAYVEKLVISNKLDEPTPKRRAVIVDSVTGERVEVEI
jgi:hypothetical protein